MTKIVPFDQLEKSDLIVDVVYKGGNSSTGSIGDEPISKILKCSNRGGFRYNGSINGLGLKFVVLYSTFQNLNWPDELDKYTGQFTYFGDNKAPGQLLHDTKGNRVLSHCFMQLHLGNRKLIPPFFLFSQGAEGHDVTFLGIAVPGFAGMSDVEDLVAVWKTRTGERFQNYRAIFTVLNTQKVSRNWINSLISGSPDVVNSPEEWRRWINNGAYEPLTSERIVQYRLREDQIPTADNDLEIIEFIYDYHKKDPFRFEKCAAEIVKLMDSKFVSYDLTRRYVDGGRDATGKYSIGIESNSIAVDYALEAKCYSLKSAVGVKETSRLISRLKHRQFGILVTTSYVHRQAYKEIIEDGHPVIVISSRDIVDILKKNGFSTVGSIKEWLEKSCL